MRKFERVSETFKKTNAEAILPTRADSRSACYDFYTPIDFSLKPGYSTIIPTDVKAYMEDDEVLLIFVRSSVGIKRHITLCNGTGIIDSSYVDNADNEGNILLALVNNGTEEQHFKAGDRICQGLFQKYLTTDDDKPLSDKRTGGIGSSGN